MEFYSKTKPELVSSKIINNINKMFGEYKGVNTWQDNMGHFYTNYIQPNLFPIIIFVLLAVYLTMRYMLKETKKKVKKRKPVEEPVQEEKEVDNHEEEISKNDLIEMYSNDEYVDTNSSIVKLEEEVEHMRSSGELSDQMIQQNYNDRLRRLSFDDMAKLLMPSS